MAHTILVTPEILKIPGAPLKPFVWGPNRHKLAWRILKNPNDLEGTALIDFNLYYIASQLSQMYHRQNGQGTIQHSFVP